MSLRRGFKTRANQISVRLRKGQGRSPQAPIDLGIIAERLGIEIVPLSVLKGDCQTAVRRLSIIDNGSFSAATLPIDSGQHIIVHNDSHDPRRQRGNLAHELAHLLLGHPFTYPIDHRDAGIWTATLRTKRAGSVPQFLFPTKRPSISCDKGSMRIRPAKCMA